jgi:hypothetical protein
MCALLFLKLINFGTTSLEQLYHLFYMSFDIGDLPLLLFVLADDLPLLLFVLVSAMEVYLNNCDCCNKKCAPKCP